MNLNTLIAQLSCLSQQTLTVYAWDQNTFIHNKAINPADETLFKALVLNFINGNGTHGKIDKANSLLKVLQEEYSPYYYLHQKDSRYFFCYSPTPLNPQGLGTGINLLLSQMEQFEKIKLFVQRKQTALISQHKKQSEVEHYTKHLLLYTLIKEIPVLKTQNVTIDPVLVNHWTSNLTPINVVLNQLTEFIDLAKVMDLSLLNYTVVPDDLNLEIKPNTFEPTSIAPKHMRIIQLLNRYEAAAQKLKQLELDINGKNIAATIEPAVSPAAITDALKKNRSKIIRIMADQPNQWTLIRQYLKPLQFLNEFA